MRPFGNSWPAVGWHPWETRPGSGRDCRPRVAPGAVAVSCSIAALLLSSCGGGPTSAPTPPAAPTTAPVTTAPTIPAVPTVRPAAVSPAASPSTAIPPVPTPRVGASPVASPSPIGVAGAQPIVVTLQAQSNSGVTGKAVITGLGPAQTLVVLALNNAGPGRHPAHIHQGTCANLNPAPLYPLTDVVDGVSVTAVNQGLPAVLRGQFAINVHQSPENIQTYIACGDIPAQPGAAAQPVATAGPAAVPTPAPRPSPSPGGGVSAGPVTVRIQQQNNSGVTGVAALAGVSNGQSTEVVLVLPSASNDRHPAHIHQGTCANLNPAPQYPLTDVVDGVSVTTVAAQLTQILSSPHAVNVHQSPQNIQMYIACGDIRSAG